MVCKLLANSSAIACQWFYNTLAYALWVYRPKHAILLFRTLQFWAKSTIFVKSCIYFCFFLHFSLFFLAYIKIKSYLCSR